LSNPEALTMEPSSSADLPSRAHPRYEVAIPVDCSTRDVFVASQFCNISRGGMFIRSSTPLPINAEVALVLRLPDDGRKIHARGRVVWNYDMVKGTTKIVPGSGIRFVDIEPDDKVALETFLSSLASPRTGTRSVL
jgi:uncharacterized protein (TIGR02266 family)